MVLIPREEVLSFDVSLIAVALCLRLVVFGVFVSNFKSSASSESSKSGMERGMSGSYSSAGDASEGTVVEVGCAFTAALRQVDLLPLPRGVFGDFADLGESLSSDTLSMMSSDSSIFRCSWAWKGAFQDVVACVWRIVFSHA